MTRRAHTGKTIADLGKPEKPAKPKPAARESYVWNGATIMKCHTRADWTPTDVSRPHGATIEDLDQP